MCRRAAVRCRAWSFWIRLTWIETAPPAEPRVAHYKWPIDPPECTAGTFPANSIANQLAGPRARDHKDGFEDPETWVRNESASMDGAIVWIAHDSGEYINWAVDNCEAGTYHVSFDYYAALGDRPLQLLVNGAAVVDRLCFPKTRTGSPSSDDLQEDWSQFGTTSSTQVQLLAGMNRIKLKATGASGNPIFRMSLTAGPLPGDATTDVSCKDPDVYVQTSWYYRAQGGTMCQPEHIITTKEGCKGS